MIFNVLFHNPALGASYVQGKAVLDIFAGTGALGLEAISRGARSVIFIENNPKILPALRKNIETLQLSPRCIKDQDALSLGPSPSPFDLIFLDPPYEQGLLEPILTQLFEGGWLSPNALLIIETAKKEQFPLPPFLSLVLERQEGAARIIFCHLAKS
jgi:16S rRNA (guanine966-N2)-methyltransferase